MNSYALWLLFQPQWAYLILGSPATRNLQMYYGVSNKVPYLGYKVVGTLKEVTSSLLTFKGAICYVTAPCQSILRFYQLIPALLQLELQVQIRVDL